MKRIGLYPKIHVWLTCDQAGVLEGCPVLGYGFHRGLLALRRRRRGDGGGDCFVGVGRMIGGGGVDVNWHRFPLEFISSSDFSLGLSRFF